MKRAIGNKTDNKEVSTETENLIANTPSRMSDQEVENSPSVSVCWGCLAYQDSNWPAHEEIGAPFRFKAWIEERAN